MLFSALSSPGNKSNSGFLKKLDSTKPPGSTFYDLVLSREEVQFFLSIGELDRLCRNLIISLQLQFSSQILYKLEKHSTSTFLSSLFLNKTSQFTYFIVLALMEIEPVSFSIPDLEQIVVKSFFNHTNLSRRIFQLIVYLIPFLVLETNVQFPPQGHLLNNLPNCLLLLFGSFSHFVIISISLFLLFLQQLQSSFAFLSKFEFELQFRLLKLEGREWNSFLVFLVFQKFLVANSFCQEEAEHVCLFLRMEITHRRIEEIIEILFLEFHHDVRKFELASFILLDGLLDGNWPIAAFLLLHHDCDLLLALLDLYLVFFLLQEAFPKHQSIINFNRCLDKLHRLIIYQINLAPNMNPLLLSFSAHIEGNLQTAISLPKKKLYTLGQDDILIAWNIDDMTERRQIEMSNPDADIFTSLAYSSSYHVFALGTQSGKVFLVKENDPSDYELAFKGTGQITSLNFTDSNKFLAIGLEEATGVAYYMEQKKFIRCREGHEEGFARFFTICREESHAISLGTDGFANVYEFNGETLTIKQRFKIVQNKLQHHLTCQERPENNGEFSIAGSTTLQEIVMTATDITYRVKPNIHEKDSILQCKWINRGTLILLTQASVFVWDYTHQNKILSLNNLGFCNIATDCQRFFGSDAKGLLYKYESGELAQRGLKEQAPIQEQIEEQQQEDQQSQQQKQLKKLKKKRKLKVKPQISVAATIITDYPQPAIESSYAGYLQNRFMFYNHIGCIIERSDGDSSLLELQYHDKFKLRRIKFQSQSKTLFYYALTDNCFMYAGRNHAYFEREVCLGRSVKERIVDRWDYAWEDIEAVLLGSDWAAIANNSEVKIFDYSGNEIHSICFDKAFLAMAAFQDQLFIAYNSAIPISSTRIFEMKAYKITLHVCKLERIVQMPVKSECALNWFGFSQEGVLFAQDTSETVRMYIWDTNQWINVYKGNEETHALFIQHIENYEIFGFKIQLKEGEPAVPTVLPRSLPRKIPLQIPDHELQFLLPHENARLKHLYLRKHILQQEEFRNRRWYKLKYSRRQDHPRYSCTSNIQSQEQLEVLATNIDIQIVECVQKLIPELEARVNEGLREMKIRLYNICYFLASYSETLRKLGGMLNISYSQNGYGLEIDDRIDRTEVKLEELQQSVKYANLSRLNALVDMGWVGDQDE